MKRKKDIYERVVKMVNDDLTDDVIIATCDGVSKTTLKKWLKDIRDENVKNENKIDDSDLNVDYEKLSDDEIKDVISNMRRQLKIRDFFNMVDVITNLKFGQLNYDNKDKQ